jgi:hypothetical protein
MVIEAVQQSLNEGFLGDTFDKVKSGVKKGFNKVKDSIYDFEQGFDTKEGNPQSIEDIFEGDGWQLMKEPFNKGGATIYIVKPVLLHGGHNGIDADGMIEEIEMFYNGKVNVTYTDHPKNELIKVFRVEF